MDKEEIEARAQEFIAFFERCKELSRSSASTSIASCLQDLQIFLESIDHWRRHDLPTQSERLEAPEAFPSLGPLLLQLSRSPVVLASASLSDQLAKTLLWFSGQSRIADDLEEPRMEETWMEERRWCASRIQDMHRGQDQLPKILERGHQRSLEVRRAAFKDLFGVLEQDLEEQVLDQKIDGLSEALQGLASMVSMKPLTTSMLAFLIVAHQGQGSLTEMVNGDYFTEFFVMAPLARRRNLLLIMDETLAACRQQPDFYSSPKTIVQQHFEKSGFLTISSAQFRKNRSFMHRLLQDIAALSGEIDDWRLVRIWILLIEWILRQAGPRDTNFDRLKLEYNASFMATDSSEDSLELLIARMAHFEQKLSHASSDASSERDVREVLRAQSNYIYCSADPEQLPLRKRLAFLLGAACIRGSNLIVRMICDSFDAAKRVSRQTTEPSMSSTVSQSATAILLAGTSVTMESDALLDAMSERIGACLRELQALSSVCKGDVHAKSGLQVQLEGILDKYAPVLDPNQLLMADIICVMGITIDEDDRRIWHSLIQAVLSRSSNGLQDAATTVSSAPILTRLRDTAEVMDILALDFTLNTVLATD
ncbi:hypothetical protein BGZ68_002052 [Mortierella alpina]|nr:hypothetical protein BGZ68_002052 [Mortierella alpina]